MFDQCRSYEGQWRRVAFPMARSTVVQLASDIRNAHRRPRGIRVAGVRADERWSADWEEIEQGHWLLLRYEGRR